MLRIELVGLLLLACTQILTEHRDFHESRDQYGHHQRFHESQERTTREVRVKEGRLRGMIVQPRANRNLQLVDVFLGKSLGKKKRYVQRREKKLPFYAIRTTQRYINVEENGSLRRSEKARDTKNSDPESLLLHLMPRLNVDPHLLRREDARKINWEQVYADAFNSTEETLSRLTQSRRFICSPVQRYPDNVRYSEETRLRSVSKSFLAAAYPRFESPDTSKDPKRGARSRASVYFGNRYYCRPSLSPPRTAAPLAFSVFARLRAARVCQLASPRVELHSRVHHSVYIPKPAPRLMFIHTFASLLAQEPPASPPLSRENPAILEDRIKKVPEW